MLVPMTKILVAGQTSEKEKILELLRQVGNVHVESTVSPEGDSAETLAELEDKIAKTKKVLDYLQSSPELVKESILAMPGTPTRIIETALELIEEEKKLLNKELKLKAEMETAKSWGKLGLQDLNYLAENGIKYCFYQAPISFPQELLHNAEAVELISQSGIGFFTKGTFVAFSREEIIFVDTQKKRVNMLRPPNREASQIEADSMNLNKKIDEHHKSLASIKEREDDIREHLKKLEARLEMFEVHAGSLTDKDIFILKGWCPAEEKDLVTAGLASADIKTAVEFLEPSEGELPPTKLQNSEVVSSVEVVYDLLGMQIPYGTVDISAVFLFSLAIFSAFVIGDAGYALVGLIPLSILYYIFKKNGKDTKVMMLGMVMLVPALIYGMITDSWFGFQILGPMGLPYFDSSSSDGYAIMQGLSFFLAALHLSIAHYYKIRYSEKSIKTIADISWVLFLWAMYMLITSMISGRDFLIPGSMQIGPYTLTGWCFLISTLGIMLFTEPSKNIFKMLLAGAGSIAGNAGSAFSDILSYIRLWAVGLSGATISAIAKNLAEVASKSEMFMNMNIVLGFAIFFVLNFLNIGMAGVGIMAHALRLNILEFSNNMGIEWSGIKYKPFKKLYDNK